MAKIPKFKTLDEAAKFWDTRSFPDYIEDTIPVEFDVELKTRKKTFKLTLEEDLVRKIEEVATRKGTSLDQLIRAWLKEHLAHAK